MRASRLPLEDHVDERVAGSDGELLAVTVKRHGPNANPKEAVFEDVEAHSIMPTRRTAIGDRPSSEEPRGWRGTSPPSRFFFRQRADERNDFAVALPMPNLERDVQARPAAVRWPHFAARRSSRVDPIREI